MSQNESEVRALEFESLTPIVYEELRRLAGRQMRRERSDHTLQPTALVNEARSRLTHNLRTGERSKPEFLRLVARTMRRVLVDHARRRRVRGSNCGLSTTLHPSEQESESPLDILALHDALERLAELSARQAQVVELRYFGGLTLQEAADAIEIGRETAKDHWSMARAWLNRELTKGNWND